MSFIAQGQGHEVLFKAVSAVAVGGDTEIIAADPVTPADGTKKRKIRIFSLVLIAKAACNVTMKSGSTAISGVMAFPANGGVSVVAAPSAHFMETTEGAAFNINTSADGVYGWVGYTLEYR